MHLDEALNKLEAAADPQWVSGSMERFGIHTKRAYGLPAPTVRKIAREIGRDHALAQELWASGIYEARLVACLIDIPALVTEEQVEAWVNDLDNWALCDHCCSTVFDKTPFAYQKAIEWSRREEEFVKRAAFALMAALAVHDKKAGDEKFLHFLPIIERESVDGRHLVMKGVNWALRQIGKRNALLNGAAIETAH